MDTLVEDEDDDDEDSYGIEGGVSPMAPRLGPRLWGGRPRPGMQGGGVGAAAGFLGTMSSKFASKVSGEGVQGWCRDGPSKLFATEVSQGQTQGF